MIPVMAHKAWRFSLATLFTAVGLAGGSIFWAGRQATRLDRLEEDRAEVLQQIKDLQHAVAALHADNAEQHGRIFGLLESRHGK